MSPLFIGSLGVATLLLAFVLNLARKLSERSPAYLVMNIVGAVLAAWYAWAEGAVPFLILEAVWGAAALVRLIARTMKNSRQGRESLQS